MKLTLEKKKKIVFLKQEQGLSYSKIVERLKRMRIILVFAEGMYIHFTSAFKPLAGATDRHLRHWRLKVTFGYMKIPAFSHFGDKDSLVHYKCV